MRYSNMRNVATCQRKLVQNSKESKVLKFSYIIRSFIGYLEGTEKSENTIKNYRSDLLSFQQFLQNGLGSDEVSISHVTRMDLEKYQEFLRLQGFKTNTRRRKILTVR